MLGAIIGDMVGSIYEFSKPNSKEFNIYNENMKMSDDSLLTIAVAKVLLANYPIKYEKESLELIQTQLGKEFINTFKSNPFAGFGGMFANWCIASDETGEALPPYNSFGNGSAMRISPVGWIANTEEEVKLLSKTVTEITHDHPEGLKGAEAVAMAIFFHVKAKAKKK